MNIFVSFLLSASFSIGCKSQPCSNEAEKVMIICSEIKNADWSIGSQLTCFGDVSIKSIFSDTSVSSVVHENKLAVANLASITAFYVFGAKVKFIPSGIKTHFINLKALQIEWCGLLSVSKENLREFGILLEELELRNNKLTSIDADLFKYNENLKGIYLHDNPIRHIEPEFFANLKKLDNVKYVGLTSAGCMNQEFSTISDHNIATFKWNNEECTDFTSKVEVQDLISNNSKCLQDEIATLQDSVNTYIVELEKTLETSTDHNPTN